MTGQVRTALASLAFADGKADAALVRALEDQIAARRLAAAELLCRYGSAEHRPAVRTLLRDPDLAVRLHVALALAEQKDKDAVPVLIDLLAELAPEQGWLAEDYLLTVAGDQAPEVALGVDSVARRRCRDAWAGWWKEHGPGLDPSRLAQAQRLSGFTLVVEPFNPVHRGGRVLELGPDNQVRWQIDGLPNPLDAQALPGDRVLIAEQGGMRVTERDHKGAIVWQHATVNAWPFACQRLRNGHTFIACNNRLLVVDRGGKEVFAYHRAGNDIVAAKHLRDGQAAFVTNGGVYTRLNAAGKEVKSFRVNNQYHGYGLTDILPNDHVIVLQFANAYKFVEYDGEGKVFREIASPPAPSGMVRLANGNTLITSQQAQRFLELDGAGQVVWEHKDTALRPWKAWRR
jgi:hypothetical protein